MTRRKKSDLITTLHQEGNQDNRKGKFPFSIVMITLSLIILSLLLLNSCTTRYYPQSTERISVVDNYAILEKDGIVFAISARLWTREPQRLSDFFTTYHIIVKNQSQQPVTISPTDIILLDEETNQYDALTANDLFEVLFYDDYIRDKFNPFTQTDDIFSGGDRITARVNFMQDAFHFGDILPGARKAGYVFFRKIPTRNRQTTIIFRNEEIVFIRQ